MVSPERRGRAFTVDLPLHLIQALRLTQALAEGSHRLQLPAEQLPTFRYLAGHFPLEVEALEPGTPVLGGLVLDHETPRTAVGELARPLIFPRAIFDHLRQRWSDDRPLHYSFSGLPTPGRRETLRQWFEEHRPALREAATGSRGPFSRGVHRARQRLQGLRTFLPETTAHPELSIVASSRGRRFPVKAWDASYFERLCQSRYVLCPDGDFVWTYRFFEAVACGALPLVENSCSHYEGFVFATLDTPLSELERRPEDLEQNFELCRERLTLPTASLESALDEALDAALSSRAEAAVD